MGAQLSTARRNTTSAGSNQNVQGFSSSEPVELPSVNDPCSQYTGMTKLICDHFQNWQNPCTSIPAFVINQNGCMSNTYLNVDSGQYVTWEPTAGRNPVGVNLASTVQNSCSVNTGPINSLPAPFGGLVTNVEFIYSAPPNNTCGENPNGPADCAKCASGYCEPYGLSCAKGYLPVKVGPCIKTKDGGSMQGWQCLPATYDLTKGSQCSSCDLNPYGLGEYASLEACESEITNNPQCSGHGVCTQGQCQCTAGYVKPDCSLQCPNRGNHCCPGAGACAGCDWPDRESRTYCGSPSDTFCCNTGQYGWTCCQ